jgi:hypothetical protein
LQRCECRTTFSPNRLPGHATWHLYRNVVKRNPNLPMLPASRRIAREAVMLF